MDRSYTVESENGLLPHLVTPCHISQAFDPGKSAPKCPRAEFKAMWDTGAAKTVITPRVIESCGLTPMRRIKSVLLQGVEGIEKSAAYEINLSLPSRITIHELTVVSKNPGEVWWDVLIGMDVISIGDFRVTNKNGKTEWSFSVAAGQ
jgi:predicted aspartyl protease